MTASSGLVGYGECLCLRPAMQQSLFAAIRDVIAPLFLGKSVEQRERLNVEARIRFASFGRSGTNLNALAAVDMALWDIAGKAAGRSLSDLLGGAERTRVPVMASLDRYNDAGKVTARIAEALAAKVAAVKVHEFDLDVIEAAQEGRRPATAVRRRLQQRPHAGRRSGQPGALAGARPPVAGRSGLAAGSPARRAVAAAASRSAWAPISARPSSSRSMPRRRSASCSPTSA